MGKTRMHTELFVANHLGAPGVDGIISKYILNK
jgi:hypothetical protein